MQSNFTFSYMIMSKLRQLSSMKELEQAQAFIIKSGCAQNSTISKLICFAALSPSGDLSYAQSIFEETTMEDPSACNAMVRAYSSSAFPIKALHIYNHMQRTKVGSDRFTFNFAIKACARVCKHGDGSGFEFCKGIEIHCTVLKLGFGSDQHIGNSMAHLYAERGLLGLARQVFDEMTERSVATWNIMISAYDKANDFESADHLLKLMPVKNTVTWNMLIRRYVRLGDVKAARRVFEAMTDRDSASWNSIIAGYVQAKDYRKALVLYHEMQVAGFEHTDITVTSVLGACAETGALEMGKDIHELLKIKGHKIEGYLGIALVDMYAKCGILSLARELFDSLKMKPVGCWNAMIVGLAVNGYASEALELFKSMEDRLDEVKPNRITFIGVLIACSHMGLVDEGREYFNRMVNVYEIMPDIKHYGCVVDLFGRWGLLDEAYQTVKAVPFGTNAVLWRSLLAACKMHGNVELAEECFAQLAKLEPLTDGGYVLLSNVYAEAERWDGVEAVRNKMMHMSVSRKPGSSCVQMKNSEALRSFGC